MLQGFKWGYYSARATDSYLILLAGTLLCAALAGCLAILRGVRLFLLPYWLICLLGFGSAWYWRRSKSINCGRNFQIKPAVGRRCRLICQVYNPQSDCRQIRRSLAEDVRAMRKILAQLPEGNYQALTHDAVCRRLAASDDVVILRKQPAGKRTLRHILTAQTHGRCRHCQSRCASWRSAPRQFYFIQFKIQHHT